MLNWCLSENIAIHGNWKTAIWAQLWKRSFSTKIHRGYSILKKHLLRNAQNFFAHYVYCIQGWIFVSASADVSILRKTKVTVGFQQFYLFPFSTEGSGSPWSHEGCGRSRVLQSKLCDCDRPYFHKMMRSHQWTVFCQHLQHLLHRKLRSIFPRQNLLFLSFSRNR